MQHRAKKWQNTKRNFPGNKNKVRNGQSFGNISTEYFEWKMTPTHRDICYRRLSARHNEEDTKTTPGVLPFMDMLFGRREDHKTTPSATLIKIMGRESFRKGKCILLSISHSTRSICFHRNALLVVVENICPAPIGQA